MVWDISILGTTRKGNRVPQYQRNFNIKKQSQRLKDYLNETTTTFDFRGSVDIIGGFVSLRFHVPPQLISKRAK